MDKVRLGYIKFGRKCGEEHPITEWARILGVTYNALYFRIKRGDLRDFENYFDKL